MLVPEIVKDIYYAPGDWLASIDVRERRAPIAWMLILTILTIPLRYPYRNAVWLIWGISELALVLALGAWTSGETPAQIEDKNARN